MIARVARHGIESKQKTIMQKACSGVYVSASFSRRVWLSSSLSPSE